MSPAFLVAIITYTLLCRPPQFQKIKTFGIGFCCLFLLLLTLLFPFIVEATLVSQAVGISPMSSGFMYAFCPSSCLEMMVEGAEYIIIWPDFNRYLGITSHAYVFLLFGITVSERKNSTMKPRGGITFGGCSILACARANITLHCMSTSSYHNGDCSLLAFNATMAHYTLSQTSIDVGNSLST